MRAVVVGAGSAGLASAAELQRAGLVVTVLEAGPRVGTRWHERYHSLRLNTLRALSGLPGLPIPRRHGNWVSGAAFGTYLDDYAKHHGLDVRTGVAVTAIRPDSAGWGVHTTDASLPTDVVVLATGHANEPCWPDWPDRERFPGALLHSAQYREPAPFAGRRVLVVGSGNSATEIATELAGQAARVWLSVRGAPLLVPTRQVGVATHRLSVLGARLPDAWWDAASLANHRLRYGNLALPMPHEGSHSRFRRQLAPPVAERGFADTVRDGRIAVVPGTLAVDDSGVRLADGQVLRPDAVIAATGYRPTFAGLLGDLPVLDDAGRPLAWGAPLPGTPGLFVVGRPSLQGDIREHGREAGRVATAVHRMRADRRHPVGAR